MIRAIIVDDERKGRETFSHLLAQHCKNVKVVGIAASANIAFAKITRQNPDLVFLDIEMPGGDGFDLLERFEKVNFKVIFTTAYGHYAIKAIKFAALDYLLKPIDVDELLESISRVEAEGKPEGASQESVRVLVANLKGNYKKVALPNATGMVFLDLQDIMHCQSDGNYTVFFTMDGKRIISTKTLKEYELLLADFNFIRVHNSHLINLVHVKEYVRGEGGFATMQDGSQIEISRRRKQEFLESLSNL